MGEIVKQLFQTLGSAAIGVFVGAWILKTAILESLKREGERIKEAAQKELAAEKQKLDIEKKQLTDLRTEFMAEAAIRSLLETQGWELRSFKAIRKRIGGFEEQELRKLLVRSGAVQFWGKEQADGRRKELWGLMDKNKHRLLPRHQQSQIVRRSSAAR